MALRNADLAILSARFGVARFGASRFGFYPDDVEGTGADEPGEYAWKEVKPPTTLWTLQSLYSFCGEPPTALFISDLCGQVDVENTFTDGSTPAEYISYWYWTFGDGSFSYDQNPSHAYSAVGGYTVTLYVSGVRGSASYSANISVMTLSIVADNNDNDVTFTPTVAGGFTPYTYLWDFGDALPTLNTDNLFGYWPLNETAGNDRVCTSGDGPDLVESGGTIADATGRFGNAVESDITNTAALNGVINPVLALSGGLTVAFWFKWPAWPTNKPETMFSLDNGRGTTPYFWVNRYYSSDFLGVGLRWDTGANVISLPLPRLGNFDIAEWHLFVLTYDPSTGDLIGRVDDGCMLSAEEWVTPLPALKLKKTIPPASLATVNASTFDRLELLTAINGNHANFEGQLDDLRIWSEVKTDAEIAKLWHRSDEEIPVYSYAEAGDYDATLVVTDANGCEKTDSVEVQVYAGPTASFTNEEPVGFVMAFEDTSEEGDGTIDTWLWDFGDDTTSSEQNPTHDFGESDTWTVTLTVTDDNEQSDSYQKVVNT